MHIIDHINQAKNTIFSFEILPPLKGNSHERIYKLIDKLREYDPKFINITSHREQYDVNNKKVRRRPGTVALAAAIKFRYDITVIPHILCGGFTRQETEYVLIDLNYLGIDNVLALRGDPLKSEKSFTPEEDGNVHAEDLICQINEMNKGKYLGDDSPGSSNPTNFGFGVAGYPEKHYLAPSIETDIMYLKRKVEAGAQYVVTQMFFDNAKYFEFVERCRKEGITVPIIPGLKPLAQAKQCDIIQKLFYVDMPEDLKKEMANCRTPEQEKQAGTEWSIMQAKELKAKGVPVIHLYTYGVTDQAADFAKNVF